MNKKGQLSLVMWIMIPLIIHFFIFLLGQDSPFGDDPLGVHINIVNTILLIGGICLMVFILICFTAMDIEKLIAYIRRRK